MQRTQGFWEVKDNELMINSERYQKIKDGLKVLHYNKLNWNNPLIMKIINVNKQYPMRKIINILEQYYWKFDTYERFLENIGEKLNRNITNIDQIVL